MIKIDNIYASTTGSLLQMINTHWCRESIQHYLLANPDYNNISIDNHKKNTEYIYVNITCICHALIGFSIFGSNSQHSMLAFHKENTIFTKNKCQEILTYTGDVNINVFSICFVVVN